MKASDISKIILSMKGMMPESSRALLAQKFIQQIARSLDEKTLEQWLKTESPLYFLADCELNSGPPWVDHEIAVHDTDLANFCNRWMNVEQFRDPSDGEWRPITAEMNQIRYTMVKELEALAAGQLEMETPSGDS